MESLPMVLNEDQALYLQENDGMYLSEDYSLAEDEDSYSVGYYPEFGGF